MDLFYAPSSDSDYRGSSNSLIKSSVGCAAKADVPVAVLDRAGEAATKKAGEPIGRGIEDVVTATGHTLPVRFCVLAAVVGTIRVRAVQGARPLGQIARQIMHPLGRCAGGPPPDRLVIAPAAREYGPLGRWRRVTPGIDAPFAPPGGRLPLRPVGLVSPAKGLLKSATRVQRHYSRSQWPRTGPGDAPSPGNTITTTH